jgi:uncharacterized protein YybS (DUF2232 family)
VLFGVTVLSGGVAVALKQVAESAASLHFLGGVASVMLLGISGTMCLVIAALLARAARSRTPSQKVET